MTVTNPFSAPGLKFPEWQKVLCPECGGEVLAVSGKVGPHNVQRYGPLFIDGKRLTDPRGQRVYGVRIDETQRCPGAGEAPAIPDERPDRPRKRRAA